MKSSLKVASWTLSLMTLLAFPCLGQQTPERPTPGAEPTGAPEAPLTNADVVKLCKLELGDEVVIAKINQAKTVDFKLDTDSLVALKQEGVGKDVIAAMLKRVTPAVPTPLTPSGSGAAQASVRLEASGTSFDLPKTMGQISQGMMGWSAYMDFPGATAKVRIEDRSPFIFVRSDGDPSGQFFIGKLDSSKKKGTRSLKMGHGIFGAKSINAPDPDWTVKFEASQESSGLWRLRLIKPLTPGEYGAYAANPNILNAGELYDFGVDK